MPDTPGEFAASRLLSLKAGDGLSDGRLSETICLVREGWLLSCLNDSDGQRQVAGFLLPGDVRWLTTRDEAAEVTALTPVKVDLIAASALCEPGRGVDLMRFLDLCHAAHRPLLEQVRLLSARSGRTKVLQLLGYLSRRAAETMEPCTAGSSRGPTLPLTRPVIADALGMTERHVSRVLKDLESEGLLRLERGQIVVCDLSVLA